MATALHHWVTVIIKAGDSVKCLMVSDFMMQGLATEHLPTSAARSDHKVHGTLFSPTKKTRFDDDFEPSVRTLSPLQTKQRPELSHEMVHEAPSCTRLGSGT